MAHTSRDYIQGDAKNARSRTAPTTCSTVGAVYDRALFPTSVLRRSLHGIDHNRIHRCLRGLQFQTQLLLDRRKNRWPGGIGGRSGSTRRRFRSKFQPNIEVSLEIGLVDDGTAGEPG